MSALTAHLTSDPQVLRLMARAALRELDRLTLDDTPDLREKVRDLAGALDACGNGHFAEISLMLEGVTPQESPFPVRPDWDPAIPESLAELMSRAA